MNAGDNLQPWIDPEIEARIVALVLGEASDFEREDLKRLLDENAELTLFKKRIEAVHGMLRDVSSGEAENKNDDWKLSAERRTSLLATLAGRPEAKAAPTAAELQATTDQTNPFPWFGLLKIAALLAILAVAAAALIPASSNLQYASFGRSGDSESPLEPLSESAPMDGFADLDVPASIPVADRSTAPKPQSATSSLAALKDTVDFAVTATATDAQTDAQTDAGGVAMSREFALAETPAANLQAKNEVTIVGDLRRLKERAPAPAIAGAIVASSGSGALREELGDRRELQEATPANAEALNVLTAASGFSTALPMPAEVDAIERAAGETIAPTSETRPVLATAVPATAFAPAPTPADLDETLASEEPFSTFSLHVSDVSFKLAQSSLAKGEWPEPAGIRIEEFVNAFDYGDPAPTESDKVACALEQSIHPFLQQRNLLRVSMRTAAAGRNASTPLRLTFLLDNSGSMERADRRQTVQRAFALLADQLQPDDQVTLISFARQPRLLADRVSGDRSAELLDLVANLPSEGGTNLEAALQLAFEKALEQRLDTAQNRIILLTDGAANLGDAQPESLAGLIDTARDSGIAFDAAGIGADGLNDDILEALTRKGDGRYYLLDRPEDADDGFARQIAGALRPAAGNVKIQIEFNPDRVGRYKLLGFEKHRLDKEDFRNDAVDAAEMAAEEAGVAVYQFEPLPGGSGDVGSVSVRFQDFASGAMVEKRWPLPYEPNAPRLEDAAPSQRIAAVAAIFAARLKGDPLGDAADLGQLANTLSGLPDRHRNQERVRQLHEMINQARQLAGE